MRTEAYCEEPPESKSKMMLVFAMPVIGVEIEFGARPVDAVLGLRIAEATIGFEVAALRRGADVPALPEPVDRILQKRAVGEDGALVPGHFGFDEGVGRIGRGGLDAPAEVVTLGDVVVQDHGKTVDPRHGAARFCARLPGGKAVSRQPRKGINTTGQRQFAVCARQVESEGSEDRG